MNAFKAIAIADDMAVFNNCALHVSLKGGEAKFDMFGGEPFMVDADVDIIPQ